MTAFVDTSLDCCDWTRLRWLGPECGLFWMALYSNGQHRTALGCTSLDAAGVHYALHCAPDWNRLDFTSVGGTGLGWTGLDRTALHGTGLLQSFFMDLGCTVLNYVYSTKLCYATLYYTIPYCIVHRVTCNNFTYFAIKTIIRWHSRVWKQ